MGVFDDKKFEELDWISQAIEPISSELNDVLESLPDSIDIDFDNYIKYSADSWGELNLSVMAVINNLYSSLGKRTLSSEEMGTLRKYFKFELSNQEPLVINFNTKTITPSVRIVKLSTTLDEKDLSQLLGVDGISRVAYMPTNINDFASRANEIMEIIEGCEQGLRSRSPNKKKLAITRRLSSIFKENLWNIKDTTLSNKVGLWIRNYIVDGNIAALSNLCRLKVMTHKGQPIYSMEELV